MDKPQTLADLLGVENPGQPAADAQPAEPSVAACVDLTGKEFSEAVVQSREFRRYIVNGFVLGDLPPAIVCRIIDHGWGKPPERIEHTGKDGGPIAVQEVRSIIVDPKKDETP